MVQRQVAPELLVFRDFMRRCMKAKNLHGADPATIRSEFADCASRFKQAVRAVVPKEADIDRLAEQAAEAFIRATRG